MWTKEYRTIPKDSSLIKEQVESGKGIVGCEMHEVAGWGDSFHRIKEKPSGWTAAFLSFFSREKKAL